MEQADKLDALRAVRRRYRMGWTVPPLLAGIGAGLVAVGAAGPVIGIALMLVALAGPPFMLVGGLGDRRLTRQLRVARAPLELPVARLVPTEKPALELEPAPSERDRAVE